MTGKRVLAETPPCWPPDLSVWPPELLGNKFLLFKPRSLWYLSLPPELR